MTDEESALWEAYHDGRSDAARNDLVEFYLPYVRRIVDKIAAKLPTKAVIDEGDLMSEAFFGLTDAISRFEPGRGLQFMTFAALRIRGAMVDGIRRVDWVPRLERVKVKKGELEEPVLVSSLDAMKSRFARKSDTGHGTGHGDFDIGDSGAPDPLARQHELDVWRRVLKGFSKTERLIALLYFREQITMKEIGQQVGICESRVSQIISHLKPIMLERLQNPPEPPELIHRPAVSKPSIPARVVTPARDTPALGAAMSANSNSPAATTTSTSPDPVVFIARKTPAEIRAQIEAHKQAIEDHKLEILAWQAVLAAVTGRPIQEETPREKKKTLRRRIREWLEEHGSAGPTTIAEGIDAQSGSVSANLSMYPEFVRVKPGVWRLDQPAAAAA